MKRHYEDKIQNWINTVQYQGRNFKDDADSKIINLAKDLKKFSEENIELLKPYL